MNAKIIAVNLYMAGHIENYHIEPGASTEGGAVVLTAHNGKKLLVEVFSNAGPYDLPICWGELGKLTEDDDFEDLTEVDTIEEGVQEIEAWALANA